MLRFLTMMQNAMERFKRNIKLDEATSNDEGVAPGARKKRKPPARTCSSARTDGRCQKVETKRTWDVC